MADFQYNSDALPPDPVTIPGTVGMTDTVTITVVAAATMVDLSDWTFTDWTPGATDNDLVVIDGSALSVSLNPHR